MYNRQSRTRCLARGHCFFCVVCMIFHVHAQWIVLILPWYQQTDVQSFLSDAHQAVLEHNYLFEIHGMG